MRDSLLRCFKKQYDSIKIFTYGEKQILIKAIEQHINTIEIKVVSLEKEGSVTNFLKEIRSSSAIVWGGGTCFMDQGGTGGVKYMVLARMLGIRVFYLGIGIDSCQKIQTKAYVALAKAISKNMFFRDQTSLKIAQGLGANDRDKCQFVPDIAFLQAEDENGTLDGEEFILFSCRDLTEYKGLDNTMVNTKLAQLTVQTARTLNINKVVNLICDSEVDLEQAQIANDLFLQNGLTVETVLGSDISIGLDKIISASYVVTARLHPAVVAHANGVPYSIYNYSDKNQKFTREEDSLERLIDRSNISSHEPVFSRPTVHSIGEKVRLINSAISKIR